MTALKEVIAYFCKHYPHKQELSKARLTKLVYLCDWKSAIERRKQITDIKWLFNHYGPYVPDVTNVALKDSLFKVVSDETFYGTHKEVITLKNLGYKPKITKKEREIMDQVIESTKNKYWNSFINLVYSTYPVRSSDRYSYLDLVGFADEYTKLLEKNEISDSTRQEKSH